MSSNALADTRVVVRAFPGPGGADARAALVRTLKQQEGIELVPNDDVDNAARERNLRADTPDGRREIGNELQIAVWIDGSARRDRGRFALAVQARNSEGDELGKSFSTSKKPKHNNIGPRIWQDLRDAIEHATDLMPGAEMTPGGKQPTSPSSTALPDWSLTQDQTKSAQGEATPAKRTDGQNEDSNKTRELTGLQLAVTMNSLHRTLTFVNARSRDLTEYRLGATPLADLSARIYPFAFSGGGWASCVGIDLRGQMAFALASDSHEDVRYPTSYQSFGAGLVARIPIKRHEVSALVDYNAQRFIIGDASGQPAPVPSVDYRAVRYGIGARLVLATRLLIGLEAAWLLIGSTGELGAANWFPRSRGTAIEAGLYGDILLVGPLSLRVRAALQRTSFKFSSQPTDIHIANGAVDQYLNGGLGLSVAF